MRNLILLTFIASLVGCNPRYLTHSTNVSKAKKKYDKILVLAKSKDKTIRHSFEEQVAADLLTKGVNAVSSANEVSDNFLNRTVSEKEIQALREKLINKGYKGVLITHLLQTEQYTDVVSGGTGTAYYPVRYGRFGRYYGAYSVNYWEPEQYRTGLKYTLESCFFDITQTKNDNLQWIGRFTVKDPGALDKTIIKYSSELTTALLEESVAQ